MRYFLYFSTESELKAEFKKLAKQLHPDKNGNASDFRVMKIEYDRKLTEIRNNPKIQLLPEFYHINGSYQYFYKPVKYVGRNDAYYHFEMQSGCRLNIDQQHLGLIFETAKRI